MCDKSLEQLIDAVIADGIITDQERKVVYKKAKSLGIDQDEIEVYLNGRLDTFKHTHKPTSNKHGNVRLCPNCGANVPSFATKCKECGHEFANTKSTESMTQFFEEVNHTVEKEKKCDLIRTYPIPNDKENLLEFLSLTAPNARKSMSLFDKDAIGWILIACFMITLICITYILMGYRIASIVIVGLPVCAIFYYIAMKISRDDSVAMAWEIKTNAIQNKIGVVGTNDAHLISEAKRIVKPVRNAKKMRVFFASIVIFITLISVFFAFLQNTFEPDVSTYISQGKYDEAEAVVVKTNKRMKYYERFDNYEKFLRMCIIDLCEKGEYQRAKQFLTNKQSSLNSYNPYVGTTQNAVKELNKIILQYEHPEEEYIETELIEEN